MSAEVEQSLAGRLIAVPEARELDVLASLLERRGARTVRCPLVGIIDAPDPQPVLAWVREFNAGAMDDLILLTGEGLRRLLSCIDARAPELRGPFIERLGCVRKITRGPKPARALRELGLKSDFAAPTPTSQGVIDLLRTLDVAGRRVGVQLYGAEPNVLLTDFLRSAGATVLTVAPYAYLDASEDAQVQRLLAQMRTGEIDAIAFTSTPQVERLFAVGGESAGREALVHTLVAAVGPVVAQALRKHGVEVQVMPQDAFFMKPLVSELADALKQRVD